MKLIETIKLALAAIWAHKLRSALTLLGMIIGVAAVVVVVSLIQGFNAYVDDKIAGIGSMSFSIYRFDFFKDFRNTDTIAAAQRRNKELTMDDYEFIRQRAQLIDKWGAKTMPIPRQIKRENVLLSEIDLDQARDRNAPQEFTVDFLAPIFLGFRQLGIERWPATPLYFMEYANPDSVARVALPLKVRVERAVPSKETARRPVRGPMTRSKVCSGMFM